MGYKENHSFKSGAWERAAIALRDKHGAYPEKSHLINKADNARKKFRMWRGLREDPEFLYNPTTRMVTASEEAWQRHFQREPLSKALRGRPFDHEEYMEILFPDVVGSGGAPKRIMKPRRRNPDGSLAPRPSTADQTVIDPSLDGSIYTQTPTQNQTSQTQQTQPIPTSSVPQPMQRPSSTTIPPRTSIPANPSALTPPEEHAPNSQAQKRPGPNSSPGYPEKRRGRPSRFSSNFYTQQSTTATPSSSAIVAPPAPPPTTSTAITATATPSASHGLHSSFSSIGLVEDGILSLAEALKTRNPPKWPEQAVEIFFREFADEDADLQLKIAEKALTDENKAMVFVKMTPVLRRHWVGRLREVHMRNLGGGLGLGGRVGEEAS